MAKLASPTDTVLEMPFRVDSISRTSAPSGTDGVWHRYVISQGTNTITGVRVGEYAEVTMEVDGMVERLNERRIGKLRKGK